jgi:hypothetical protein
MDIKHAVIMASILVAVFSIETIAAFTANGDLQKLNTALNEGLEAGLTNRQAEQRITYHSDRLTVSSQGSAKYFTWML